MEGSRGPTAAVAAAVVCVVVLVAFAAGVVLGRVSAPEEDVATAPVERSTTTTTTETVTVPETEVTYPDTDVPRTTAPVGEEDDGQDQGQDEGEEPPAGGFPYTLTVHTDGCGVIRTELDPELENLGWSVLDEDGFETLSRNALGETRYRFFEGGTYSVELTAWGGDSYVPVSNRVQITC